MSPDRGTRVGCPPPEGVDVAYPLYKIYAESFKDHAHLNAIVSEAQEMMGKALAG